MCNIYKKTPVCFHRCFPMNLKGMLIKGIYDGAIFTCKCSRPWWKIFQKNGQLFSQKTCTIVVSQSEMRLKRKILKRIHGKLFCKSKSVGGWPLSRTASLQLCWKENQAQVFPCEFCEFCYSTYQKIQNNFTTFW